MSISCNMFVQGEACIFVQTNYEQHISSRKK